MSPPNALDVQAVVFEFTRRCFAPKPEQCAVSEDDEWWIREFLKDAKELTPATVALWPSGKRLALYNLLSNAVILLGLSRDKLFAPNELDGSSAERLAQPLLSGLGIVPPTILGESPRR